MGYCSRMFFLVQSIGFASFLIFSGCGQKQNPQLEKTAKDTLQAENTQDSAKQYFQIQNPADYFATLHKHDLKPVKVGLNSAQNIAKYQQLKEKAINYGIYTSDVCFAGYFDPSQNLNGYVANINSLSRDLVNAEIISEKSIERINNNPQDKSFIINITSEAFTQVYNVLEKNDNHPVIAFIEAGALVENLYLSTGLSSGQKEDSPVYQYIADQKYTLENLIDLMNQHAKDPGVPELLTSLRPLIAFFNTLREEKQTPSQSPAGNKVIIGSESRLIMTTQQFNELKDITIQLRNEMTKTK